MPAPLNHQATVLELISNVWATQSVATFARLCGPDHLAQGAKESESLAGELGVDRGALERLLRGVAAAGVVRRQAGGWELTSLGHVLRKDVPGSMRSFLIAEMAPGHWLPWGQMEHSVRTGTPATHVALGMSYWSYCKEHPDEAREFAAAMSGLSSLAIDAVLSVEDFAGARRVVDVGGSHGALLAAVLGRHPQLTGILFDLPHVIEGAVQTLRTLEVSRRVEFMAGSFFDSVPPGGDVYLLKHILHDWSDDECVTILRCVQAALPAEGRLLVVEMVLDEVEPAAAAVLLDLNMLVMHTGRERTLREFDSLFERAGLKPKNVRPTDSPYVVLDVRRA